MHPLAFKAIMQRHGARGLNSLVWNGALSVACTVMKVCAYMCVCASSRCCLPSVLLLFCGRLVGALAGGSRCSSTQLPTKSPPGRSSGTSRRVTRTACAGMLQLVVSLTPCLSFVVKDKVFFRKCFYCDFFSDVCCSPFALFCCKHFFFSTRLYVFFFSGAYAPRTLYCALFLMVGKA